MRITEDRYSRDRRRFDLALRMIGHEARTQTIRYWTGLSDDRIRKLYRSYAAEGRKTRRHRGKSPSRANYFLGAREHRRQAAMLAGIFATQGLLDAPESEISAGCTRLSLDCAERFCEAYEAHRALCRDPQMSFEHGTCLLHSIRRSTEVRTGRCPACQSLMVVDALRKTPTVCTLCDSGALKVRDPDQTQ